jgi:hypothetical protein
MRPALKTASRLANTGPAIPIQKPPGSLIGSPLAVKQISDT